MFKGLKTLIAARLLMVASLALSAHDFLLPLVLSTDWSPITAMLPAWVWPLFTFAIGALFSYLRTITTGPVASQGSKEPSPNVKAGD